MSSAVAMPWDINVVSWVGGLDDGRLAVLDPAVAPSAPARIVTDPDALLPLLSGDGAWTGKAAAAIAAHGLFLHCQRQVRPGDSGSQLDPILRSGMARIQAARPRSAAVADALGRLHRCFEQHCGQLDAQELCARLLMEARRWQREDAQLRERIVSHLGGVLPARGGVLLHGAAATHPGAAAIDGVIAAVRAGRRLTVLVAGGQPTAADSACWALGLAGIPATRCTAEEMAAWCASRRIHTVLVGAEAIALDGTVTSDADAQVVAGTALANHAAVVVASSTTALTAAPALGDHRTIPPAGIIMVTEHGVLRAPFAQALPRLLSGDGHPPAV